MVIFTVGNYLAIATSSKPCRMLMLCYYFWLSLEWNHKTNNRRRKKTLKTTWKTYFTQKTSRDGNKRTKKSTSLLLCLILSRVYNNNVTNEGKRQVGVRGEKSFSKLFSLSQKFRGRRVIWFVGYKLAMSYEWGKVNDIVNSEWREIFQGRWMNGISVGILWAAAFCQLNFKGNDFSPGFSCSQFDSKRTLLWDSDFVEFEVFLNISWVDGGGW